MRMSTSAVVALKTVLSVFIFAHAAALVYSFSKDHYSSCFDPHARWMQVGLLVFCIDISFIWAWFLYKESNWIKRVVFLFILFWFGSVVTCGYILIQFFNLSPEEYLKHPFFSVLAKREKGDMKGHASRHCVVTARVIFTALGCSMLAMPIYTLIVDGSPLRVELLTPCAVPLGFDIFVHAVVFSVWIIYKESSWISAFFWILSLVCFTGIAICAYVVRELFYLSPEQPVSLVLFNKNDRDLMMLTDPLLAEHSSA